jgi:hypothetical protein
MTAPVAKTRQLRVVPVVALALGAAALIAWALRDNARFLPKTVVPLHALGGSSHSHSDTSSYVPPAPVTGDAVVNYPGLILLAVHLVAIGIVVVTWAIRRYYRRTNKSVHSVPARFVFAALVALSAALITLPIAAVSLGNAILFTGTLAAAMTVLQYTFVLGIVGVAIFGVP